MSGGGKKQTVGYKYYLGAHLVLCHGPIDKIIKIDVDDKTAWIGEADASSAAGSEITIDKPSLFGGESREGGVAGSVDVLSGHPAQARNSYLLDKIGSALVSAYRGVTSLVLKQVYVGNNPYLKPWAVTAQRIHTRGDGQVQWYDGKAEIRSHVALTEQIGPTSDGWRYKQVPLTDSADYSDPAYDDSSWALGSTPFANQSGHPFAADSGFPTTKGTTWDLNSKIWIRRVFTLERNSNFTLTLFVDNLASVWVNGTKLLDRAGTIDTPSGPAFTHEIHVPGDILVEGDNTIVLAGEDEGSYSYAAFKVTAGGQSQFDMNPAHIIRECLTDTTWGRGLPESEIGPTYTTVADQLYAEALGMSILWTQEAPIEDFVSEIMRHIDAVRYEDPETGLQEIKLIRGDYDPATLPLLDPTNSEVTKFDTPAISELVNQVTVTYWNWETNSDASITVQDTAAITAVGTIINQTYEYPGLTNDTTAAMVAQRDLAANSRPFARGTVRTNRSVSNLKPGDVFKLTDPDNGITEMICRVAKRTDSGLLNGEIVLEFGEDVFGTEYSVFSAPSPSGWTDPVMPPQGFSHVTAFELPYYLLIQQIGDNYATDIPADVGYFAFAGGVPTTGLHLNYDLFVYPDGVTPPVDFSDSVKADFTEIASVSAAVDNSSDSTIPISGLTISEPLFAGSIVLVGDAADDQREIMALSADLQPGATSLSVLRGVADTLPRPIASGTVLYFIEDEYGQGLTEFAEGETAEGYGRPVNGRGSYSGTPTYLDLPIVNRVNRPYPAANVRLDGQYDPQDYTPGTDTVVLTWNHRDRLAQSDQAVSWFENADYGPEAGTTYRVDASAYDSEGALLQSSYFSTDVGAVGTYSFDVAANPPPAGTLTIELRVTAVKGGLDSLQSTESSFGVLRAPTGLTAEVL
ncbi:phage tail protein [Marinobacterium litorale]|uniref:phage tail protein n=1 Tax=Marinobacterium litorale TaxID=404770 RepID=UPI0003FA62CE|nr:phage tail protein [Marinobacterium litorale]